MSVKSRVIIIVNGMFFNCIFYDRYSLFSGVPFGLVISPMARTQQDENEPPITGKKEIRVRAFVLKKIANIMKSSRVFYYRLSVDPALYIFRSILFAFTRKGNL